MKKVSNFVFALTIVATALAFSVAVLHAGHAGEHPGDDASHDEHAGEKAHSHDRGDEHAGEKAHGHGDEHAGDKAKKDKREGTDFSKDRSKKHYDAEEIRSAITGYVEKDQELKNGYFFIHDEKINRDWKLTFSKLHPVRIIEREGEKIYFACSNFDVVGSDEHDVVDLDFWMKPNENGKLSPYKIRIHKVDGEERFVYKNDRPVEKK